MKQPETGPQYLRCAEELNAGKPIDAYKMDTFARFAKLHFMQDIAESFRVMTGRPADD